MNRLAELLDFIAANDGINDKSRLIKLVVRKFDLTQDRSFYYCDDFAIRFSSSKDSRFSNTVLSLSNLRKVDHVPFLACLVTPTVNSVFLANTTLLRKISHTSQQLRVDNIRGSFNGSDILRELEGIKNVPANFQRLFDIHAEVGFEDNLPRLVEATNDIVPTGHKFIVQREKKATILGAPERARMFVASADATTLKRELDDKVKRFRNEIVVASLIENVNVRGRIIEYLIAGGDEAMRGEIIEALRDKSSVKGLPAFKTANTLGDYERVFKDYFTQTDVKTKVMVLSSNPKGYNLDKMLEFLSMEKSVFMFYFVGVDPVRIVNTALVSMFQVDLLNATILLKHWSGRNSRGVSQLEGKSISQLITNPKSDVDIAGGLKLLKTLLAL